ncbi:MAG: hypothetical protein VX341_14165 [Bdellovibrionota bacterium]|nr:hypothetical protein [Bdellovibrionota bacterium]
MKLKNLLPLLLLLSSANVFAESFERVLKDETHQATVKLNDQTVRCSALGYGMSELKVTLDSLLHNTIFDHSNQDGLGPCITAGVSYCAPAWDFGDDSAPDPFPTDLIDPNRPTEEINVRVVLKETFYLKITPTEKKCFRNLVEDVNTEIRGIKFTHNRTKYIGMLSVEECEQIKANLD